MQNENDPFKKLLHVIIFYIIINIFPIILIAFPPVNSFEEAYLLYYFIIFIFCCLGISSLIYGIFTIKKYSWMSFIPTIIEIFAILLDLWLYYLLW